MSVHLNYAATWLRPIIRILFIILVLSTYMITAKIVGLFSREPGVRRSRLIHVTAFFSRWMLQGLRMTVTLENPERRPDAQKNYMIVSNHLSYVDIWAISSIIPSCFVTSVELQKTFLGPIAAAGGSLFVERRSPSRLLQEIKEAATTLRKGSNVTVFPEATTSNGEQVLPFRRGLLEAALHAQMNILPIVINYDAANGESLNREVRDSIFYYGDMEFVAHLWRLCSLESLSIRVKVLDELPVDNSSCTRTIARTVHEKISANFHPVAA